MNVQVTVSITIGDDENPQDVADAVMNTLNDSSYLGAQLVDVVVVV